MSIQHRLHTAELYYTGMNRFPISWFAASHLEYVYSKKSAKVYCKYDLTFLPFSVVAPKSLVPRKIS